jgi:thiamine pyrophosphokinase
VEHKTVIVVTGAAKLRPRALAALPTDGLVVAVDGGLDHALDASLSPAVVVGDLDSVSPAGLTWAEQHAEVIRHPADKDATDTELALAWAAALAPNEIVLVAGAGDRIDHTVAALGALGAPALADVPVVRAWWGDDEVHVARPGRPVTLDHPPGTTFSVLAMHGPCRGVSVAGARWPLDDVELAPVAGLGVSNETDASAVTVSVATGTLTVIVPGDVR